MNFKSVIISFSIFQFLIFQSCQKCDKRERILTDCNFKYWDLYRPGNEFLGSYRFDIDGSCYYLREDYSTGKTYFFYTDDVKVPNAWKFIGSDTIAINGYPADEIIKFSQDSIILKYRYLDSFRNRIDYFSYRSEFLVPSKNQTDKFNFDSLKLEINSPYYFHKLD